MSEQSDTCYPPIAPTQQSIPLESRNTSKDHPSPKVVDHLDAKSNKPQFWKSWYFAIMFCFWGLLLNCLIIYTNFPSDAIQILQSIGSILYVIGLIMIFFKLYCKRKTNYTFNKVYTGIMYILVCITGIIILRLKTTSLDIGYIRTIQAISLLFGVAGIFLLFYGLDELNLTKESIRSFLKSVTPKGVFTFLLALIGAITVIVPFIEFVLSLITGKH